MNLILIFIMFGTLILRLPSLLEPFWYGDEGIYLAVAQGMQHGLSLYTQVFDNKPPFIYILSDIATSIFGHSIWSVRFVLLLWVLATQVVIYFLAKKLFSHPWAPYIATTIFGLLTATPLIEGNIANGEIFFILLTSLGFLLGFKKKYFWAGVSFACAVLFKAPAVFDFMAFGFFLLLHQDHENLEKASVRIIKTGLGFALPLALTAGYFLWRGHFNDFFFATLKSNIGYTDVGNHFIIPNGLLYLKGLALLAVVAYFLKDVFLSWKNHTKITKPFDNNHLLILWLSFSLYGALFGGRNYSHYLIQLVPAFTLVLTGIMVNNLKRITGVVALVATIVIVSLFGFRATYLRTSYYTNTFRYVSGQMSQIDFNNSFDRKVSRNYTLAAVAKKITNPKDTMFIWANEPQIYFLADRVSVTRFTAAYHVAMYHAYQDTLKTLSEKMPRIIIIENPYPYPFPELTTFIHSYYSLAGEFDDAQIYQLNTPL